MNERLKRMWERDKEMIDCVALYIDHIITLAEAKFHINGDNIFKDGDTTNIFDGDIRYQFVLTVPLGVELYIYDCGNTSESSNLVFELKNKFGDIDIVYNGDKDWIALKEFAHAVKDYSENWKYVFENGRLKYDSKTIE
jgi:hypothetical protein